jgi:hypothetical protein
MWVGQATFTAVCLFFVVHNVDWQGLRNSLGHIDVVVLVGGMLLLALQPGVASLRWLVTTRALGASIGFRESAVLTYISMFFNQALPASVGGDAIKIVLMHRGRHPLRLAFTSTTIDRAAMLFGLLLLVAGGVMLHPQIRGVAAVPLLVIAALIGGVALILAAHRIPSRLLQYRIVRVLSAIAVDLRLLALNTSAMLRLAFLVFLGYAVMSTSLYLFVVALSEPLAFSTALVLAPMVLLASILPISIGGWGAREAAAIAILGTVGVSAPGAVAASIIFGLSSTLVLVPGVILYLLGYREIDFSSGIAGTSAEPTVLQEA